ncbi:MAG: hypothetical protein KJZ93_05255 [Caldilineaceae bacterium]|nr:hypothetical protein [Caldilineaceae bacterium]
MTTPQLFRLAGWSAYLSVAAMFAAGIFPIISVTGLVGKLENLAAITLALSMFPLALALHRLYQKCWQGLNMAVALMGAAAMLVAAGVKSLVLIDAISPEDVADLLDDLSFAVIGVWLILVGCLGWFSRTPSARLAGMALIAGIGQVFVTGGFLISEPPPLWALAGGGVTVIAYPIWAITMGRWLLRSSTV